MKGRNTATRGLMKLDPEGTDPFRSSTALNSLDLWNTRNMAASENDTYHVFPLDEETRHVYEGMTCTCGPRHDHIEPRVIIHSRFEVGHD